MYINTFHCSSTSFSFDWVTETDSPIFCFVDLSHSYRLSVDADGLMHPVSSEYLLAIRGYRGGDKVMDFDKIVLNEDNYSEIIDLIWENNVDGLHETIKDIVKEIASGSV